MVMKRKVLHKILLFTFFFLLLVSAVVSLGEARISAALIGGKELQSPGDWIKEEQIKVYKDRVVIDINDASWAGFTDTNSMDPFIDKNTNAIEISPKDPQSINVGDVISYQTEKGVIIHRVIDKGRDKLGVYYLVKGDNNNFSDPFKVRFENVKGVVVAVIY
ncbi:MAG: signal peptidase I [Nanoarchaeota archaeon]